MTPDSAYAELIAQLKRVHSLGSIAELLGWDEQVNLPPESADQRGEQHAVLAEVIHAASSNPRIGELLTLLEREFEVTEERSAVIKEARKDFDRATKLPADF